MAKILFDIPVSAAEDWADGHLVMEVSQHIFSYVVINPGKKLLHLRFYQVDANNGKELAENLYNIITSDDKLKTETAKKTLLYNFPESELMPENLFNANTGKDVIELLHGDLNKGITLSEKIENAAQYIVYKVPQEVHSLLQNNLVAGKYCHYYNIWLQCCNNNAKNHLTYASVIFYPHRILVNVIKDGQLNLLQSYTYEAAEDVGYYLLNIYDQLGLSPETTPVVLSGMIDVASALYIEIHKYFGLVELDNFSENSNEPALSDYPAHFFSPLLKLALCVS